jgi:hypothetical protein
MDKCLQYSSNFTNVNIWLMYIDLFQKLENIQFDNLNDEE